MHVDFIIVGQGLSGSLLSMELLKKGCRLLVTDNNAPSTASKVAGGIINPVTGKRLVKSWMADELLPFAEKTYNELAEQWQVSLLQQYAMLDFHATREQAELFAQRMGSEKKHLDIVENDYEWAGLFRFNYVIGKIEPCYILDIRMLVAQCRAILTASSLFLEGQFNINDCIVSENGISYKEITADKIIFCEGAAGADNPYFTQLPWAKDKGEALIVSIPGLPRTHIYKQGISIIPWQDDLFWIGAAHDWKFTEMTPTPAFRKNVTDQLDYWLKLPYEVTDHLVAQRPANVDRRPFAGFHPKYKNVGILNGMGGKGCSMAPYFAHELAEHLTSGAPISPAASIKRFERVLSR